MNQDLPRIKLQMRVEQEISDFHPDALETHDLLDCFVYPLKLRYGLNALKVAFLFEQIQKALCELDHAGDGSHEKDECDLAKERRQREEAI